MQRKTGGIAPAPNPLAVDFTADRLAGVFDNAQGVALCNRRDSGHVARLTSIMYRHDRFGPRRDNLFDLIGINDKLLVGVDEDRSRAGLHNGAHRSDERAGTGNDFVARADAHGFQR